MVTLTGPRQSGKSTLARAAFPDHTHVNLERPDLREAAEQDPRALLTSGAHGLVLDEVQRVPALLSWIQAAVDDDPRPGRFILTGSNQHALSDGVAQTLAGRTTVLRLLPPDLEELRRFPSHPTTLWETVHAGAFPRIHDVGIPAERWLSGYVATYLERDVRQLLRVSDLSTFQSFVRLAAGRTSQELNLASLGADAGVSQPTARGWLGVLETSFLAQRVPAFHRNTRKQIVKAPKLHLVDAGLAAWLIGVRGPVELATHPLRGALFETWVASEIVKQRYHRAAAARVSHWRESRGVEIDLVVDDGATLWLVEVKSGQTIASDWFGPLRAATAQLAGEGRAARPVIVYGGDEPARRHDVDVIPWHQIGRLAPTS
ncbi:MAG: ATP-binding protein [Deltaproteobacteria bacterium]|nr:ATP-binding protein [Deltaproteobacteria bacterium]